MKNIIAGIKKELKELDVSRVQLIKFGFVVGGILLLLALVALYHAKMHTFYVVAVPGIILFTLGVIAPMWLRGAYKVWMGLSFTLGAFVGMIILSVLYYLFVTPIALLVLLFKGNPLEHVSKEGSYWIPRTSSWTKETMEQLF